jgi:membrane protein implicated in regulation of membrane protease activity
MAQLFENPAIIWFLIGLALLLAELVMPGLIVIFFGVGAWVAGLAFLVFDLSFNSQLVVFMVTSLLSLLLFRKSLQQRWWEKRHPVNELTDEFMGRTCQVTVPILPGPGGGKVNFKGTTWKALSNVEIPAGQTVRIIGKDSIILLVEPV